MMFTPIQISFFLTHYHLSSLVIITFSPPSLDLKILKVHLVNKGQDMPKGQVYFNAASSQ